MSRSVTITLTAGLTEFSVVAGSRRLAQHLHMHLYETKHFKGREIARFFEENLDAVLSAIGTTEYTIMNILINERTLFLSGIVIGSMLDEELASNIQLSLYYCD